MKMSFLTTNHQRKSAIITTALIVFLLFLVFNFGLSYVDPPEEYGVAINFGTTSEGYGNPVENIKKKSSKNNTKEVVQKESFDNEKPLINEKIITNTTSKELPVAQKNEPKEIEKKTEVAPEIPSKSSTIPKPSKETQDALNSLLKGTSNSEKSLSEGVTNRDGVQGKKEGNLNSNKYYGNSKSGTKGNYNLSGRVALSTPKRQPDCQEEGTVVVQITVDREGKVIRAVPGAKGTTNTAPCLAKPAKQAALSTKWNPDKSAPNIQIGTIIYKFSLSN